MTMHTHQHRPLGVRALVWATALAAGAVSLPACAGAAGNEPDPSLYPRKLGEIKAMIQVHAPEKGAGSNTQSMYIQRLKQYRYICGVPYEDIQWDAQLGTLAQKAALVCAKLNKLTHTPEKPAGMSDEDYNLAKTGAGQSNLFQGKTHPVGCVDGWMDDSDQSNIDRVGHRRWCLNPSMLKTAFGAEGGFAAMHAHDHSRASVPDWDFVAYPARGFMPTELFGNRHAWSVSPNMAKYAQPKKEDVQISLKQANEKCEPVGAAMKFDYTNVENSGFGSGTAIIFRPETINIGQEGRYVVEIAGLKTKDGKPATISYLVHFVHLQKVPDSPDARGVYTAYFQQRLKSAQAVSDKVDQADALTAMSEDKFLPMADPAVATTLRASLAELLKDPAIKKEQEAAQQYKLVADFESKAGKKKDKIVQAAVGYRNLAEAFKGTRAGAKAAEDFERLKKAAQ